jgi:hypothetical protein
LFALAWWIYRPDVARSFDLLDFPYILQLLQESTGLEAQIRALASEYRDHGRFNLVTYAHIALQWSWFGVDVRAWQLSRFVLMGVVLVLLYAVFRRLRLTRAGAFAGAGVFVVSPAAMQAWTLLTLPEPLGIALLLVISLITLRRPKVGGSHGVPLLAAVGILMATVLLTKEILLAACALPFLVSWAAHAPGDDIQTGSVDRQMVLAAVSGAAVALIPIAQTYLAAPSTGYAARYSVFNVDLTDLVGSWWSAFIPFAPLSGSTTILPAALLAFAALVVTGWGHLPHSDAVSPRRLIATAVSLPLIGAIAYAPWPSFRLGYALPFLFGGALLVAGAISGLQHAARWLRTGLLPAIALTVAYALSQTVGETRSASALREALVAFLPLVHRESNGDAVIVAAPVVKGSNPTAAFYFSQLARANGVPWPETRSATCEEAATLAQQDSSVLVVGFASLCPTLARPYRAMEVDYVVFDWASLRPIRHTYQLTISRAGVTPGSESATSPDTGP